MAATVALPQRLRADDIFFPRNGVAYLGVVVLGFGQSYLLPVCSVLSCRISGAYSWRAVRLLDFFLVIQTSLVALGRSEMAHDARDLRRHPASPHGRLRRAYTV